MSGRSGLRRARVLVALSHEGQTVYRLGKATQLKGAAVQGILDSLCLHHLVTQDIRGHWRLQRGPELDAALAEARALLEAQEVGA